MEDLTRSIQCKHCQQSDLWDILGNTASCANCATKRPFYRKKSHSGEISPSQQKAVARIKKYFEQNRLFGDTELAEAKVTFQQETGLVYLNIKTDNNILVSTGGFFVIGRRGGIKILHANTISKDKVSIARHFAKMLGAKVGR